MNIEFKDFNQADIHMFFKYRGTDLYDKKESGGSVRDLSGVKRGKYSKTDPDKFLIGKGVSKSKIVIGAAFYGKIYTGVENINHGLGQAFTSKKAINYTETYTISQNDDAFTIMRNMTLNETQTNEMGNYFILLTVL